MKSSRDIVEVAARLLRLERRSLTAHLLARRVWDHLIRHHARESSCELTMGTETAGPPHLELNVETLVVEVSENSWHLLYSPPDALGGEVLQRLIDYQRCNSRRFSWSEFGPPSTLEIRLGVEPKSPSVRVLAGEAKHLDAEGIPVVGRFHDSDDMPLGEARPPHTEIFPFADGPAIHVLCDCHGTVVLRSPKKNLWFREVGSPASTKSLRLQGPARFDVWSDDGVPQRLSYQPQPRRPVVAAVRPDVSGDASPLRTQVLRGWRASDPGTGFELTFGPPGSNTLVEAPWKDVSRIRVMPDNKECRIEVTEGRVSLGATLLACGSSTPCRAGDPIYIGGTLKLVVDRESRGFDIRLADENRVQVGGDQLEPLGPSTWDRAWLPFGSRLAQDGYIELRPPVEEVAL